jgi:hypothetical protein
MRVRHPAAVAPGVLVFELAGFTDGADEEVLRHLAADLGRSARAGALVLLRRKRLLQ